jgi:surfactin synthase thioesterase subunit
MDLPNARVELLPGGHFLLETSAEQVGALIKDFLTTVTAAV